MRCCTWSLSRLLKPRSIFKLQKFHTSVALNSKSALPSKQETLPKFTFPGQDHSISYIQENGLWGESVTVFGWIDKKPKKIGENLVFARLRDSNGDITQIVVQDPELINLVRRSMIESCVCVIGVVQKRHEPSSNKSKSNENEAKLWELKVTDFHNLNPSDISASHLEALRSTPDLFPQKYRYLQLRLPYFQNSLKKRSKAAQIVRNELVQQDFMEVETPLLFKSTPEGAREFLVPTRKKSKFYALPQSPQQYKQLLMASGIRKYFQVARCFRDEDLRADRQPEFTQIDLEMAFANAKDVQTVIENLVKKLWRDVANEEIESPGSVNGDFIHLTYQQALEQYGIDKPDLRSDLKIQDLSNFASAIENASFPVLEACILRASSDVKDSKIFDESEYSNRAPVFISMESESDLASWQERIKHVAEIHDPEGLDNALKLQLGDILAISTRQLVPFENPTPLGRFRQLIIANLPKEYWHRSNPLNRKFFAAWVEDFPLFSPQESDAPGKYPVFRYDALQSTHHPFTMAKLEDYELLDSDPIKVRGEHYDLVMNGIELGGGSRRVHDSKLQQYIFESVLKIDNYEELFGHLLKAFSVGCPPHAGLALGFDRICAMLVYSESIRDVIAFPKTQSGTDLVVQSPSKVSADALKEYFIKSSS